MDIFSSFSLDNRWTETAQAPHMISSSSSKPSSGFGRWHGLRSSSSPQKVKVMGNWVTPTYLELKGRVLLHEISEHKKHPVSTKKKINMSNSLLIIDLYFTRNIRCFTMRGLQYDHYHPLPHLIYFTWLICVLPSQIWDVYPIMRAR